MHEPDHTLDDPGQLLARYLDFYRDVIARKVQGMTDADLRRSRVPSGWTPLGLVQHLTYVERRWFRWGFMGQPVENPWGPNGLESDWVVGPEQTAESVLAAFRAEAERSRAIVAAARLGDRGRVGGRFTSVDEAPTLAWILFHVLQEYARHAGHLDIVRELVDGAAGE